MQHSWQYVWISLNVGVEHGENGDISVLGRLLMMEAVPQLSVIRKFRPPASQTSAFQRKKWAAAFF